MVLWIKGGGKYAWWKASLVPPFGVDRNQPVTIWEVHKLANAKASFHIVTVKHRLSYNLIKYGFLTYPWHLIAK